MTLQKQLKCANDPIYMITKNKISINDNNQNKKCQKDNNEPDILKIGLDSR